MIYIQAKTPNLAIERAQQHKDARAMEEKENARRATLPIVEQERVGKFKWEVQKLVKIHNGFLAFQDREEYAEWIKGKEYLRTSGTWDFTFKVEEPKAT